MDIVDVHEILRFALDDKNTTSCHSDDRREEESRCHKKLDVHEILRFALDDKTLRLVIQTTVGRKNPDDIK